MRKSSIISSICYIILIFYACFTLYPFLFSFITSIKYGEEVYSSPITYIVHNPTLKAYVSILFRKPFGHYVVNSIIISSIVSLFCFLFGTGAAYAFSRYNIPFKKWFFFSIIGVRLFPPISFIIPFFLVFSALRLLDTKTALIISNLFLNLPFYIWIAWSYFQSLPKEIEEASAIDGCSKLDTLVKIAIPIAAPGIAAATIVVFLFTWSEYLFAVVLSQTPISKPVSVGSSDFIGDVFCDWNEMAAGGLVAVIPSIIFVLLFQKYIVRGLTAGAVKG
jgi:multiple sugar transport system permease protein